MILSFIFLVWICFDCNFKKIFIYNAIDDEIMGFLYGEPATLSRKSIRVDLRLFRSIEKLDQTLFFLSTCFGNRFLKGVQN